MTVHGSAGGQSQATARQHPPTVDSCLAARAAAAALPSSWPPAFRRPGVFVPPAIACGACSLGRQRGSERQLPDSCLLVWSGHSGPCSLPRAMAVIERKPGLCAWPINTRQHGEPCSAACIPERLPSYLEASQSAVRTGNNPSKLPTALEQGTHPLCPLVWRGGAWHCSRQQKYPRASRRLSGALSRWALNRAPSTS